MTFGTLQSWKNYFLMTALFLLVFLGLYFPCNWVAAHRAATSALYLPCELRIPFLPGAIWVYGSLLLLWPLQPLLLSAPAIRRLGSLLMLSTALSGCCFLLFPAHLGYARVMPSDPMLAAVFRALFAADRPHNLVPSLHVANCALVLLAYGTCTRSVWGRSFWGLWLLAIALSTLMVHQHHLLDVVSGLGLALLLHLRMPFRSSSG